MCVQRIFHRKCESGAAHRHPWEECFFGAEGTASVKTDTGTDFKGVKKTTLLENREQDEN